MFPPLPVYSPNGYFHEQYNATTTTSATAYNNSNNSTQPEDIELAQTGTTPEVSKQPRWRRDWNLRAYLCAFILFVCVPALIIYVGGCISTRLNAYYNRGPERLFRAECEGAGGRIAVHKDGVAGWGVDSIDCTYERAEGRMDLAEEMRTRTRRLDMQHGGVAELDSYGYSKRYRELMGSGFDGDYSQ